MKMPFSQKALLLLFLALLFHDTRANTSTQTISNVAAWQNLDKCAQSCFQHQQGIGCTWAPLDSTALGCGGSYCSQLAINDCYCRGDKQQVATAFLSSCIHSACSAFGDPMIDVSSGVSIYEGYCTSLGYEAAVVPANVPATTTAGIDPPATQTGAKPPSTSAVQSGSCTVGSLSCGAVGGISFASVATLLGAVAAIFRVMKKNKSGHKVVTHINVERDLTVHGAFQTLK